MNNPKANDEAEARDGGVESLRECVICHAPMGPAKNFTCCVERHCGTEPSTKRIEDDSRDATRCSPSEWHDRCLFRTANEKGSRSVVRCPICGDPVTVDVARARVSDVRNRRRDTDGSETQGATHREEARILVEACVNAKSDAWCKTEASLVRKTCDTILLELFFVAIMIADRSLVFTALAGIQGTWLIVGCPMMVLCLLEERWLANELDGTDFSDWTRRTSFQWKNEVCATIELAIAYAIFTHAACDFVPRDFAPYVLCPLHMWFVAGDIASLVKNKRASCDADFLCLVARRIVAGLKTESTAPPNETIATTSTACIDPTPSAPTEPPP